MMLRVFLRRRELLGARPPANAARCSVMPKSTTFACHKSPRGRVERQLVIDSRLACLGAAACALRRPSGATSALPPPCLAGRTKSAARGRPRQPGREFQ